MAKKQERGSAYFRQRLQAEHPAIYADLLSGIYPSQRAACLAAGLIRAPSALNGLKAAWARASNAEQRAFLLHLKTAMPNGNSKAVVAPTRSALTKDCRLEPWASAAIPAILAARRLKPGRMMTELGRPSLDMSLMMAIASGTKVMTVDATTLTRWCDQWTQKLGLP